MTLEVFDPHAPTIGVYTCQQVAELLHVSYDTIRRECRRGHLGHMRVGDQIRITARHLDAYLAGAPTQEATTS